MQIVALPDEVSFIGIRSLLRQRMKLASSMNGLLLCLQHVYYKSVSILYHFRFYRVKEAFQEYF